MSGRFESGVRRVEKGLEQVCRPVGIGLGSTLQTLPEAIATLKEVVVGTSRHGSDVLGPPGHAPSPVRFGPITRSGNFERAHRMEPLVHWEDAVRVVEHLLHTVRTLEGRSAQIVDVKFSLRPVKAVVEVDLLTSPTLVDASLMHIELLEDGKAVDHREIVVLRH